MEPRGAADKPPAAQHGLPLGVQPLDAGMEVLLALVQGTVRLRLETDGVGAAEHGLERNQPDSHREMLFDRDARPVHPRQAVLRHLLDEHDLGDTEGQLPCAELGTGRTDAAQGRLSEDYQGYDAPVVRVHVRARGGCGLAAVRARRKSVVRGCEVPADSRVLGLPLSAARHQPQYAAGGRSLGPVPQTGDSQENNRDRSYTARNLHQHRVDALGVGGDRSHQLLAQLHVLRQDDRLRFAGPAEGHRPVVRGCLRDDGGAVRADAHRTAPGGAPGGPAPRRGGNRHRPLRTAEARGILRTEEHRPRTRPETESIKNGKRTDNGDVSASAGS